MIIDKQEVVISKRVVVKYGDLNYFVNNEGLLKTNFKNLSRESVWMGLILI
jgi:hypothetical protein